MNTTNKTKKSTVKKAATKKAASKKAAPKRLVNLIDVQSHTDLMSRFAWAKHRADEKLTDTDIAYIIANEINKYSQWLADNGVIEKDGNTISSTDIKVYIVYENELPWYKRLWNKVKSVFKR